MIKCKEANYECKHTGMCCLVCEYANDCEDACAELGKLKDPAECVSAYEEENALAVFENQTLVIMQNIVNHKKQMDKLKKEDEDLRKQLTEDMQKFVIKSFENDILKITSVAETTRTIVDSKKLKDELPKIYDKYSKTSKVSASVRIEVK